MFSEKIEAHLKYDLNASVYELLFPKLIILGKTATSCSVEFSLKWYSLTTAMLLLVLHFTQLYLQQA